jgi:hypothetical protein
MDCESAAKLLTKGRGSADRGEHRQAAGAFAQSLIAVLFGGRITDAAFVRSTAMEKHELSKIDFEMIDKAFKAIPSRSGDGRQDRRSAEHVSGRLHWLAGD